MEKGKTAFTAEMNTYMNEVAKFCSQYLYALESTNPLDEFFPVEEVSNGEEVEISVIAKAAAQAFDSTGVNIWKDHKPTIATEWNPDAWDDKQFIVTMRYDEIRKALLTNKSPEEAAAKILDSITQGCNNYRYKQLRELMTVANYYKDYATIGKYTPKTMSGVLAICKDAYHHLRASNADCCANTTIEMEVPAEDIYTLIPSKVMDLLDTTELANLYNLEKANLIGKIIVVNVDDLDPVNWYKVKVIDRKAVRRYRRNHDYTEDRNNTGRFTQEILFNSELNFMCGLFKAVEINCTAACEAKLNEIATKSEA